MSNASTIQTNASILTGTRSQGAQGQTGMPLGVVATTRAIVKIEITEETMAVVPAFISMATLPI
jgi:hypothetical protein